MEVETSRIVGRHALVRQVNEQRVLDAIFRHGPISRVEVAEMAGLSKPTVNTIVRDLVEIGLVQTEGTTSGSLGRAAALYGVNGLAGMVLGVDLGGTKVRAALADLYGEIVAEQTEPTDNRGAEAVIAQVRRIGHGMVERLGLDWQQVSTVGFCSPGVIDPATGHVDLAYNIPGFGDVQLHSDLCEALGVEVIIHNDVNMAAMGEKWRGLAAMKSNFAFLAIGTGFGMGLVIDDALIHGARGAAGEIAYLPIGRDVFDNPEVRVRGALEEAAASSAIEGVFHQRLDEGMSSTLRPGARVADIFAAAADGDAAAIAVIDHEARLIAQAILAVSAVVDPQFFLLGGGIGSNPLLLEPVRRYVDEIAPYEIQVETSALGDRASVLGALAVGLHHVREKLFSEGGIKYG